MTIAESLKSISLYPITRVTLDNICDECGLDAYDEISVEVRNSSAYKKAKAQIYMYLADAPSVSEGNMHFSFTQEDRQRFANKAAALAEEIGEEMDTTIDVGWIGEDW